MKVDPDLLFVVVAVALVALGYWALWVLPR